MRKFLTIVRREWAACFLSPIAYVTAVAFAAVTGMTFLAGVYNREGTDEQLLRLLTGSVVLWLTFLTAIVSMRLFAEEKRSGTIETLMTAPVTEAEVVAGKFTGALLFVAIAIVPVAAALPILERFSPALDFQDIDLGAAATSGALILLVSAFFLSVGLLVSLTTRNQIVAAIACLAAIWTAFMLGDAVSALPSRFAAAGRYMSLSGHVDDFSRGLLDTRTVVLYVSLTGVLLFISTRVLESRRWK